ncbi:MAG: transcriptional regulator [Spirochaetales bacterium]|nr:transcriptional regulator [Spirochaetales bacterium]
MKRNTETQKDIIDALNEFAEVLSGLSADNIVKILQEIMTPAEIEDLSLRWLLMKKLKGGMPQRRIAEELHISLCKITRGSKVLKNPSSLCSIHTSELG